jgi:hypothetical protein
VREASSESGLRGGEGNRKYVEIIVMKSKAIKR